MRWVIMLTYDTNENGDNMIRGKMNGETSLNQALVKVTKSTHLREC